jgi:hypothetical protein
MTTLPALPRPEMLDVATIATLGAQLTSWAETTDDVAAVRDAAARWAAITEYMRRTSREGVAEAEAALRRLEVRVGALLGPARLDHSRAAGATSAATEVAPDARHVFRVMAAHPDVVEEVIAQSNDASPPSRRKCLTEIARRRDAADLAEAVAEADALAPRIRAALAALPEMRVRTWLVLLRIVAIDEGEVRSLLPDESEVVQLGEEAPA